MKGESEREKGESEREKGEWGVERSGTERSPLGGYSLPPSLHHTKKEDDLKSI